jgi:hypothetical protein
LPRGVGLAPTFRSCVSLLAPSFRISLLAPSFRISLLAPSFGISLLAHSIINGLQGQRHRLIRLGYGSFGGVWGSPSGVEVNH